MENTTFKILRKSSHYLISAGFLLLYLALPSANHSYADDSLRWAYGITQEGGIINSHHLIINALREAFILFNSLFDSVSPSSFLTIYSSLWGGTGLLLLSFLLKEVGLHNSRIVGVTLCGISVGYWSYSIVGDVYVPATASLVGGTLFFLKGLKRNPSATKQAYALLSVLFFLTAIMHHQAFFVFVIGLGFIGLLYSNTLSKQGLTYGLIISVAVGLACIAIYVSAHKFSTPPHEESPSTLQFMSGYASSFTAYPDMKDLSPATLIKGAGGFARSLVSTNILFSNHSFVENIQNKFPYRHMLSQVYLAEQMTSLQITVAWIGLFITVLIAAPLTIFALWCCAKNPSAAKKVLIFSVVPQMLFFLWWESISDEFWIWILPFWAMTICFAVERLKKNGTLIAIVFSAALLAANLCASILPYSNSSSDIDQRNSEYINTVKPGDLLISFDEIITAHLIKLSESKIGFEYINLFGPAEKGRDLEIDKIIMRAEAAIRRGNSIHLGPYLIDPPRSYMALVELQTKDFSQQRDLLIQKLMLLSRDSLKFHHPNITIDGAFSNRLAPE